MTALSFIRNNPWGANSSDVNEKIFNGGQKQQVKRRTWDSRFDGDRKVLRGTHHREPPIIADKARSKNEFKLRWTMQSRSGSLCIGRPGGEVYRNEDGMRR